MPVPRPSYPMIGQKVLEGMARDSGIAEADIPGIAMLLSRVLDKQAIDERLNYRWIAENMGGGGGGGARFATIVIAASNSTAAGKAVADYVCTGTADQVTIQAAFDATPLAKKVVLLEGTYAFTGRISIPDNCTLSGMGYSTYIHGATANQLIYCRGNSTTVEHLQVNRDTGGGTCDAIYLNGSDSTVHGCFVFGDNSSGGSGIVSAGSANRIYNNEVFRCPDGGIGTNSTSGKGTRIFSNYCGFNGEGISLIGQRLLVFGNYCEGNKFSGILLSDADDSIVTANYCTDNSQSTTATWANISIGANTDRANVQMNTCRKGALVKQPSYGIEVLGGNDNFVTNNDLKDSGITGSFNDLGVGTITAAGNRL